MRLRAIVYSIILTCSFPDLCVSLNTTKLKKNKQILVWTPLYEYDHYLFGDGKPQDFIKAACPYFNCEFIKDPSLISKYSLDSVDAVLFHGYQDHPLYGTPNLRLPNQLYIFICLESVRKTLIPERRKEFYNMTITYRLDSDIPWPYFNVYNVETGGIVAPTDNPNWTEGLIGAEKVSKVVEDIQKIIDGKNYVAAWFVSHCNTPSNREANIATLQKLGLPVHVFGKCGNYTCPHKENCNKIISEYYFYLAYENSICEDYVTEKVLNAYNCGTVPIVWSGANLTKFLPPNSYIDASKLSSNALISEINRLMSDKTAYREMFLWRLRYNFSHTKMFNWKNGIHPFCKLCEALHTGFKTRRTVDVFDWWNLSPSGQGIS